MDVLAFLLFFISVILFIAGLIFPKWVIRWGKSRDRKQVVKVYGTLVVISLFLFISFIVSRQENGVRTGENTEVAETSKEVFENKEAEPEKTITIQEVMSRIEFRPAGNCSDMCYRVVSNDPLKIEVSQELLANDFQDVKEFYVKHNAVLATLYLLNYTNHSQVEVVSNGIVNGRVAIYGSVKTSKEKVEKVLKDYSAIRGFKELFKVSNSYEVPFMDNPYFRTIAYNDQGGLTLDIFYSAINSP